MPLILITNNGSLLNFMFVSGNSVSVVSALTQDSVVSLVVTIPDIAIGACRILAQ